MVYIKNNLRVSAAIIALLGSPVAKADTPFLSACNYTYDSPFSNSEKISFGPVPFGIIRYELVNGNCSEELLSFSFQK